jgi:hypothetical protein
VVKDDITYGGFEFVNNSGEAVDVDVTPSTDPNTPAHPVERKPGKPTIPVGLSGTSPYDASFQSAPQQDLIFFVVPPLLGGAGNPWSCYQLHLHEPTFGVKIDAGQAFDQLQLPGACQVERQDVDGNWFPVPDPEITKLEDAVPVT